MNEISQWKEGSKVLHLDISSFSNRPAYSAEINRIKGEGGALNADYRTAEAIAIIANKLGKMGLTYGKDFIFKTVENEKVLIEFSFEVFDGVRKLAVKDIVLH